MKYINRMEDIQTDRESAITLGKFDGFHRGHQKLLEKLRQERREGFLSVVFTFDVPPQAYIGGKPPRMLLTWQEKCALAERLGADWLIACPFTDEIRNMEAERFVEEILVNRLHVRQLAAGEDFHFGYQRGGDVKLLEALSGKYGYQLWVIEKERDHGQVISSTLIREELAAGHMERVNQLLGYPFCITGEIVHGAQLGRTIGMPTINLRPGPEKLLPPNGVYVSTVEIEGVSYQGVTNIGYKPTVSGAHVCGVETYLLHAGGDLYGKQAKVMLHTFIRPEQKFHSVEELTGQMNRDARQAERYFQAGKKM